MEFVARLFPEARAHQRRRRRRLLAAAAFTAALAAAAGLVSSALRGRAGAPPPIAAPAGTPVVDPAAVFSQDPYMGVHCPAPNSIACDTVGLAVWLRRPARAVSATIDGRPFALDRFGDQPLSGTPPRTSFDGYLHPAGIRTTLGVHPVPDTTLWDGDGTPEATVWLLIDYGAGHRVLTHTEVPLAAGWG